MVLTIKSNSGSNESYMGNGIFVDDAEILNLNNTSGQTSEFQKFSNDLSIEIKVRMHKNDWERTFNIGGNLTKDQSTGEITNWGGAFKVRDFFLSTGQKEALESALSEIENGHIPREMINDAIGKNILVLSYRNKKDKTSTWNQVFSPERKKDSMKDYFLKEWEKSKSKQNGPYPSNYKPDGEEASFNYGANTETNSNQNYGNL